MLGREDGQAERAHLVGVVQEGVANAHIRQDIPGDGPFDPEEVVDTVGLGELGAACDMIAPGTEQVADGQGVSGRTRLAIDDLPAYKLRLLPGVGSREILFICGHTSPPTRET